MDLKKYLKRINFRHDGDIPLTLETLTRLQQCHQENVPWENLDAVLGKRFKLNYQTIYDKVVTRGRGGWCHELNGLLCWALREIGFQVSMLNGRSWLRPDRMSMNFDHMGLLIRLGGEDYIVEVGWGITSGIVNPLHLVHEQPTEQPTGRFKLTCEEGDQALWTLWYQNLDEVATGPWGKLVSFQTRDHPLESFEEASGVLQRGESEDHIFMGVNPIISLRANEGEDVKLLIQRRFRHYSNVGAKSKRKTIAKEDDLDHKGMERVLRDVFNMSIDLSGNQRLETQDNPPAPDWDLTGP